MGQKIHPQGFRLGVIGDWKSRWTADRHLFGNLVVEDYKIREFIAAKLDTAGLEQVEIERPLNEVNIIVKVSKPGLVIGKGGSGVEELQKELSKFTASKVKLTVEQVKVVELSAQLVADYISRQLKRRVPTRRIINTAMQSTMDKGAKGIRVKLSGLLSGGSSISRKEPYEMGSVPTQTLRSDIDYAQVHCFLPFGTIGIKVWIYKGEA